jgi:hypothetical protein
MLPPLFHLGEAFVDRMMGLAADGAPLFELTDCILLLFTLWFDLLSVEAEMDNVEEVGVEALLGDEMILGDEDESGVLFKFKSLSSFSLPFVLALVVLDVFASGFVLGILKLVLNVTPPKPNTDCGGVFGLIKLNMSCFLDLSFLTTLLSTPARLDSLACCSLPVC